MKNMNTMLHMKLNTAVSVFAVAAAFSVLLPPSNAFGGICFLPDCQDSDTMHGDINMNTNSDTEWCEKNGYTYYASGKCPQYQAVISTCSRDENYLKCDETAWCKQNGYNTETCSLPSFVDGQCPNGKPYYKQCKEDRPRACREAGYVNSCSPGRLYATSNRCPYDNSYGKCCNDAQSKGCPSNYKVTCDPSRGSSGTDTCGYTCYRCCSDECSRGSKNYTGSYATTTECGSTCRYCKDCTSGSTSYSGSYVGPSECGNCYSCSDTCRSGQKSVSCDSDENKVRVSSTECGNSCYECQYNTDCSVTSKSCDYGCASTNSCSKCTSCNSTPPHSHSYSCPSGYSSSCSDGYSNTVYQKCSCGSTNSTKCYKCNAAPTWKYLRKAAPGHSTACWKNDEQWWIVCKAKTYCVNGSTEKYICELSYGFGVGNKAQGSNKNSGYKTEAECNASGGYSCAAVNEMTLGSCDSSGNKSCSY